MVEEAIEAAPGLRLEYFEIVDGNTLQKVNSWEDAQYVVGCITVFCGEVRLIDNIKYKEMPQEEIEEKTNYTPIVVATAGTGILVISGIFLWKRKKKNKIA